MVLDMMMLLVIFCTIFCSLMSTAGSVGSLSSSQCPAESELKILRSRQQVEHERLKEQVLSQIMSKLAMDGNSTVSAFVDHHFSWLYRSKRSLQTCLLHANGMVPKFDSCLSSIKPSKVASKYFEEDLVEMFHTNELNISSVLDFGSGSGDYLRRHFELGSTITVGIETEFLGDVGWYARGWDFLSGPVQFRHKLPDYIGEFEKLECSIFSQAPSKYDLVQTLEVFEHIPRESHCLLLNFLASRANSYLIAGIARLGQKGLGHISNRDRLDFAEEWKKRGFVEDIFLTRLLRARAFRRAPWLRRNTIIYKVVSSRPVNCEEEKDWKLFENHEQHTCYHKSQGEVYQQSCQL